MSADHTMITALANMFVLTNFLFGAVGFLLGRLIGGRNR